MLFVFTTSFLQFTEPMCSDLCQVGNASLAQSTFLYSSIHNSIHSHLSVQQPSFAHRLENWGTYELVWAPR